MSPIAELEIILKHPFLWMKLNLIDDPYVSLFS